MAVFDRNVFRSLVFDVGRTTTPVTPSPTPPSYATRTRTLRQMCVEADPDFYPEGRRPVAYEFGGGKRIFREITDQSGPYSDS